MIVVLDHHVRISALTFCGPAANDRNFLEFEWWIVALDFLLVALAAMELLVCVALCCETLPVLLLYFTQSLRICVR